MRGKAFILIATIAALGCAAHGQSIAAYAVASGHWSKADEKEYQACNSRYASAFANKPESWCEIWEEHQHWMRAHPKLAGKKDDPAKFYKCTAKNKSQMNATPQGCISVLDECLREAYGLPYQLP